MPPPPPPPAPPPPMFGGGGPPKSGGAPDRGALLSQIRGGAALKKAVTNDRSDPLVANTPNNGSSGAPSGRGNGGGGDTKSGGSSGAPLALGGLFAGGMPKLKPAGQRGVTGATAALTPSRSEPATKEASPPRAQKSELSLAAAIANRAAKMQEKSSNVPSVRPPLAKSPSPEQREPSQPLRLEQPSQDAAFFPKDVSPPQMKARTGPPLPSKPPAGGVARSTSQSQQQQQVAKRPTHKPPPPPKSSNVAKFGTMGHPKRTPSSQNQPLARRQSFGAPDTNQAVLSLAKPQTAPPPPPPRNMSVPSNINTIHRNPPPIPPSLNKAPSSKAPLAKPPPPPNKTASRSTPHLAVKGSAGSFDARYNFHNINDLSVSYDATQNKNYPSKKAKKPHQRRAPLPPPDAAPAHMRHAAAVS